MNLGRAAKAPIVERKGERIKFKPKRWSHQDDLQANIGEKIQVWLINSNEIGKLVAADAWTIKIALEDQSLLTVYKSAIIKYKFR